MAENEKRAFKVNAIDILITLIIAAVLALGALMIANAFGVSAAADKEAITVEYTIQFKGIRAEFASNIKKGDTVVDSQKRHNLGVVVATPTFKMYETEVYDEESRSMKMAVNEDYITLEVKVSAEGYISEEMYFLKESDKEIGVGNVLYINTPDFCGTGYVSRMNIVKGE